MKIVYEPSLGERVSGFSDKEVAEVLALALSRTGVKYVELETYAGRIPQVDKITVDGNRVKLKISN